MTAVCRVETYISVNYLSSGSNSARTTVSDSDLKYAKESDKICPDVTVSRRNLVTFNLDLETRNTSKKKGSGVILDL